MKNLAEGVEILNESVSIEEVEGLLDVDLFEGEDCKTIGGLLKRLVEFLEKISRIKLARKEGYELSILEVDEKRIKKMNIYKVLI
ncbi:MAG: hypothetical protein KHY44_05110 [Clostridiales bacterium]|nr:hypothetical protein [Clostridiales bacterium]